jgi:hypothetical protein
MFHLLTSTMMLLLTAAAPASVRKGPPWISIELPANPWDQTTKGAFLLVHAFHHGLPLQQPISGTAEGIVNGKRRSIALTTEKTSRPGVFALRNQWGTAGRWVLVLTVDQGEHPGMDVAQAIVEISEQGSVTAVRVPLKDDQNGFPRKATAAEIEAALKGG